MKYSICTAEDGGLFSLPGRLIEKLPESGESELKILLLIYAHAAETGCDCAAEDELRNYCEKKGFERSEFDSALCFWRGAGLISASKKAASHKEKQPETEKPLFEPDKKPEYSGGELADAVDSKADFRALVDFTQKRLGKLINQSELEILFSLYDYLKMPADVIMLAVEHCASEGKGSIRYVEKLLISFADDGIDDYEKAESYINRRREFKSFEGKIRNLCGLGSRALTKREKAIVSGLSERGTDMALIELAYEKTVSATGKPSLAYMDKILSGWSEEGIKNPADAEKKKSPSKGDTEKSYDLEDFFKAAVSRERKTGDKKQEG